MDNKNPKIDIRTSKELLALAIQKAKEVSRNQLSDFSPASPLMAILEAVSLLSGQVQFQVNNLADTLENKRINSFGLARFEAKSSIGIVQINLDGLYSSPFFLAKGFKIQINNIEFKTLNDLIINPFVDSGSVGIIASNPGKIGNLSNSDVVINYDSIKQISSILLLGSTNGGIDSESDEDWQKRIYGTLWRRNTLISEEDFEIELKEYLGINSFTLAIGRLKPDRIHLENGYVYVFGLNPDRSPLNLKQISDLQIYFSKKVAMATVTVGSIETFNLNIKIILTFNNKANPKSLSESLKTVCFDYLNTLEPGMVFMVKALEGRCQRLEGVVEGAISIIVNGLSQNQTMPNLWSVGKYQLIEMELISDSGSQNFPFQFTF